MSDHQQPPAPTLAGRCALVTGGAGFLGRALSPLLVGAGMRVVAVDSLHPQIHDRAPRLHPGVELVVGDVTAAATWDAVLPEVRPDVVVHLAAETGTGQSLTQASRHADVNVVGTGRLLDALVRHDVLPQHLLLASSRAVYGEGAWQRTDGTVWYPGQRSHAQLAAGQWDFPDAHPLPSDAATTWPRPTSVYSATKLAQEHMMAAWSLAHGVPLSVLRLQNVYGPGQSLVNAYTGIVVLFCRLARAGLPIPLYEDGEVTRDLLFVGDAAAAFRAAMARPPDGARCLDIGSGSVTSLHELADRVATIYRAPGPVITGRFRDGDVRHASCRIGSAVDELGWSPVGGLADGLVHLDAWIAATEAGDERPW